MRFPARLALAALTLAAASHPARAQDADRAAVRQAALDYVEGFYDGDSTRLLRAMAPNVRKTGWYRTNPDSGYRPSAMSFPDGFMAYARAVREGREKTPPGAPKDVVLFEVQDQTASAKVTAWWGTDYLLLGKQPDGRWTISHVLWQSPAATRAATR